MYINKFSHIPALIIGSIVKVCPAFITPTALFPVWIKGKNTFIQEARNKNEQ